MMPAPRRAPQNGYRRGGKQAYHGPRKPKTFAAKSGSEATSADEKREAVKLAHSIDEAQGFPRYDSGKKRVGWLVNLHSTTIEDEKIPDGRAGLDCYFIEEDGSTFKATLEYDPYFLVAVKRGHEPEAEEWLKRAPGGGVVKSLRRVEKEDLQMPNHLLGYRRTFFELRFSNVSDLLAARRDIMPIAEKNKKNMNAMDTYAEVARCSKPFLLCISGGVLMRMQCQCGL
jgi:DNA polymerase epsilon subunit 1